MIDWLTLKLDASLLSDCARSVFRQRSGRLIKISPDGAVEWEQPTRESVRSDSHQTQVVLGTDLTISGSPARVTGPNNVFGSGFPVGCAEAMVSFVERQLCVQLPHVMGRSGWRCTRIDVTHNYDLLTPANVRQALLALRHAEGGRYQLRTTAESVYWSTGSSIRSGKAYAKGPHIEYLLKQGKVEISDEHRALAHQLLRLELSLRSQFWRERAPRPWFEMGESDLDELHEAYFSKLIGSVEVSEVSTLETNCVRAAERLGFSAGRGRAAYVFWGAIAGLGLEVASSTVGRSTRMRHLQILRAAGLSWADFQAGRVVALRREPLVLRQPVRSWADIRRAA